MSKLLRFILCISIFNAGSLLAMDNQSETHYQVLGVEQNANATQIKKAYFKLAKQWHPDKNKSENAKSMFQKIGNAYRVLSDEKKRAKYDRKLESSQFQYNNSYSPFSNSSYYQSQTNSSFNYSSFDPDVFFEEILRRQREELHRQQETSRHQQELHREYEEQERLRKERKRREREARRRQQERERRQQERLRREREQREREQRARTHCICGERNNLFQLPCQHRVCEEHLVNSIHYRFNSLSLNKI